MNTFKYVYQSTQPFAPKEDDCKLVGRDIVSRRSGQIVVENIVITPELTTALNTSGAENGEIKLTVKGGDSKEYPVVIETKFGW
jgi:hypothetical protein